MSIPAYVNLYGRTLQAVGFYEYFKTGGNGVAWMAIARWTAWTDENDPDPASYETTHLDEIIGYAKCTDVKLVREDSGGSINFLSKRFSEVSFANRFLEQATGCYFESEMSPEEIPVQDWRVLALYSDVTPASGYESRYFLLPYGCVVGTTSEDYTVVTSSNDKVKFVMNGDSAYTYTVTLTAGTRTAAQIVADINAATDDGTSTITFTNVGLAWEGDGRVMVKSLDTSTDSSVEVVAVSNDAYTDLGFTVGTYVNEVAAGGVTIVTNGNMEAGSPPSSWTASSATLAADSDCRTGSQSLEVTDSGAGGGYAYQNLSVSALAKYSVSVFLKPALGDTGQIELYDVSNSAQIKISDDFTSNDWGNSYSTTFTAPAGCTSVQIRLTAKNAGDVVNFDDVSVTPDGAGYLFWYSNEEVHTRHVTTIEQPRIVIETQERTGVAS